MKEKELAIKNEKLWEGRKIIFQQLFIKSLNYFHILKIRLILNFLIFIFGKYTSLN